MARQIPRSVKPFLGTRVGLSLVFREMARRFDPARAEGFQGAIQYELTPARGRPREWFVTVEGERAHAHRGRADSPQLTLGLSVADFILLIAGELHPARALIEERLTVTGDLHAAVRLEEMFR